MKSMTGTTTTVMSCSYGEMTSSKFTQAKKAVLDAVDLSKKGSVDEPILELIQFINFLPQYFTTSSCSGRSIIVADDSKTAVKKKGCKWLYVTHGEASFSQVLDCLKEESLPEGATLKFEPFIMHLQCLNLESARQMLQVAIASGYRNSGISLGKSGKIILAVRSTAGLEVPLVVGHKLLVSEQYIELLIHKANQKMQDNHSRVLRFHTTLKGAVQGMNVSTALPAGESFHQKKSVAQVNELPLSTNAKVSNDNLVWTADLDDEQLLFQLFDPL